MEYMLALFGCLFFGCMLRSQPADECPVYLVDADCQKAFNALQKMLWEYSYSEKEADEAESIHEALKRGHGKLAIHDLKLNNLEAGKQAGIDSMKFEAEFTLP